MKFLSFQKEMEWENKTNLVDETGNWFDLVCKLVDDEDWFIWCTR